MKIALDHFNKALKIHPNYPEVLSDKAAILAKLGKYTEALETVNEALKSLPEPARKNGLSVRNYILRKMKETNEPFGKTPEIKKEKRVEKSPSPISKETEDKHICNNCGAEVDTNRNICMRCGAFYNPIQNYFADKVMQEQNMYSAWLSEAPSFKEMGREVNYNEGLRYLEKMQLNEALKFYEKAVKEQPSNPTNWNNLGVSFMGLKDRKNALNYLKFSKKIKFTVNIN